MNQHILAQQLTRRTPCGFAFVEYFLHSEAVDCLRYISGTKLDERIIRCDIDPGYKEGRQFGRGKSGGQVRDEFRQEYDSGRGEKPFRGCHFANVRRMGTPANRGGATTARAGAPAITGPVRYIRRRGRIGYGRRAQGRGCCGEAKARTERGRGH